MNRVLCTYIACCLFISCEKTPTESDENQVLSDIDGNTYEYVQIGDQVWMTENLRVEHFRSGDEIPYLDPTAYSWANADSALCCRYENIAIDENRLGLLYNWYAVSDSRQLAPEGWRIPNKNDWETLINFLGGDSLAGGCLKYEGTVYWDRPNDGASNSCGFSAFPGGKCNLTGFCQIGECAYFWSKTESTKGMTACRYQLACYNSSATGLFESKNNGYSVRCIKE